jgi:16S rRNA processing protein RimM
MAPRELVLVGVITGAHGIKGEVKVKSFTADPKAFSAYGQLTSKDGRGFEITKAKFAKDDFICTLKNVVDRNQSEALRGIELFVAREKMPKLPPGEFYLHDLEGKPVLAADHKIGVITGFQNFGAGELLELEGGTLIPLRFVREVNEAVILDLPDGYLDEAKPE